MKDATYKEHGSAMSCVALHCTALVILTPEASYLAYDQWLPQ